MTMTTTAPTLLRTLRQANETIAYPSEDVRGLDVVAKGGEKIGKVDALLVDSQEKHVRYIRVESGGFAGFDETKVLIPVDAITRVDKDTVFVDQTRGKIASAPVYDPDLTSNDDYYVDLHGFFGYGPYWAEGYGYPRWY